MLANKYLAKLASYLVDQVIASYLKELETWLTTVASCVFSLHSNIHVQYIASYISYSYYYSVYSI